MDEPGERDRSSSGLLAANCEKSLKTWETFPATSSRKSDRNSKKDMMMMSSSECHWPLAENMSVYMEILRSTNKITNWHP